MKPGRCSFGKQNGAHKGFEHTWRMNRIDIKIYRPVVLQGFALAVSSLNALEKPSTLHIVEYAIFVLIKRHVAIELEDSVDRLSLLDDFTSLTLKIHRQVHKRGRPFCLVLRLSHKDEACRQQKSLIHVPQP